MVETLPKKFLFLEMFIPVGKYLFGKVAPLLLLLPLAALPDAILAVKIDQLFGLFSTQ